MNRFLILGLIALTPAAVSALGELLIKKTFFGRIKPAVQQIFFGIVFGALAVLSTEYGIPVNGAQVNCRDAAVLSAGLFFGAPAGIIAGLIGGIERWFASLWGIGVFTRIACSVSTVIAGFYSAFLRKYIFDNHRPSIWLSFTTGVIIEVFHMTMVFLTNMGRASEAMTVVSLCTVPMILVNGFSVFAASAVLALISAQRDKCSNQKHISQRVQNGMLFVVVGAFLITSVFVYSLQQKIADNQAETILGLAIDDVSEDIVSASDKNLLTITKKIRDEIGTDTVRNLKEKNKVAEINIIDSNGIITESTDSRFLNYNMNSGEQSRDFLVLLGDCDEYVQPYGPIAIDKSISRKYAGVKYGNGFIQVGYDSESFYDDIHAEMVNITANRHVGQNGFIIIYDEMHRLVSAPSWYSSEMLSESTKGLKPSEGEIFNATVNETEYLGRYLNNEGYAIVSLLPTEEAYRIRNIAIYVNTFMEILVFAVLFVVVFSIIKRVVVSEIKKINMGLDKISGGTLDESIEVRSSREFSKLSDDINTTVDVLKKYIADAESRIDRELALAKEIQSSALPSPYTAFRNRSEFDVFATMVTAKEVGGDFYDFYIAGQNQIVFLIADVSGKGIPAAMFMMRAKTELKSLTESGLPLGEVFAEANRRLCEGNDAGMFVTAWQGAINLETGELTYVNAGHNPPLIRHANGQYEFLKCSHGFVLAGLENVKYKSETMLLESGDSLFLYTDGITEATDTENRLFGNKRLIASVNSEKFESMRELCESVGKSVNDFVGSASQFDDITMLGITFNGVRITPNIHFDQVRIEDIPTVTDFVDSELEKIGCPLKAKIQIDVAIDEIYSNIVKYAYPEGDGPVTVKVSEIDSPHSIRITFIDEGIPYNPLTKEDPDITLPAEMRNEGGLGIFMVKKTMDDMQYRYTEGKNILIIRKNI